MATGIDRMKAAGAATEAQPTAPAVESSFAAMLIIKSVFAVLALLLLLALVSYTPEDTAIIGRGVGGYARVTNWIGPLGAIISGLLILWIGLAAYPASVLLLVCIGVRIFRRPSQPVRFVYIAAVGMCILGTSMLLGVFADSFARLPDRLNIPAMLNIHLSPGGVIGQRLCAPWTSDIGGGWLAYVIHPVGCIIISAAMIVVGLTSLWYFDWLASSRLMWAGLQKRWLVRWEEAKAKKVETDAKKKKKKAARKKQWQANLKAAGEPPAPEPVPVPVPVPVPASTGKIKEKPARKSSEVVPRARSAYKLPALDLLDELADISTTISPREIMAKKEALQETFDSFGIDACVGDTTSGPRVTLFEIRPSPGVKVERISSLANNVAMNLKAESLRILTPIPGKDTVGIEVPNSASAPVSFREIAELGAFKNARATIPIIVGKNISGKPVILDLSRAPHLLIAGATGSGKSVCMNTLIVSLLYRFTPDQLKMIMIDPKVVEFSGYNSLPHLVTPVVTNVKKVPIVLRWILQQMEWRYQILAKVGVRDIAGYNSRKPDPEPVLDDNDEPIPQKLPFLVIIIDELADIMMTAKADVETSLARVAQLARAVGIHAVIATQRPSVNIITGVIKANFPTRIAFQVSSVADSRTIMDGKGAESLLGRGDMLFKPPGGSGTERTQGALITDDEIERIVQYVADQAEPEFVEDIFSRASSSESDARAPEAGGAAGFAPVGDLGGGDVDGDEELIQQATQIILQDRRATTSHVQRRLRIGYNRAALIIETLEERGIIGSQIGTAPRQILVDGDGGGDTDYAGVRNDEVKDE